MLPWAGRTVNKYIIQLSVEDYAGFLMLRQCAILSNDFAKKNEPSVLFSRDNAMHRKAYFGLLKTAWKWMKVMKTAEAEKNPFNGQDQTDNSCTMSRHKGIRVVETSQNNARRSNEQQKEWKMKQTHSHLLIILSWILLCVFFKKEKVNAASAREGERESKRKSKQTE